MKLKLETGFYFLIIILVVLIALSVVLFFSLQTDEVAAVLESNQPLNILFILEDDKQPLFTDIVLYYPPNERGALFDIPSNVGLISPYLDRMDRIDAVYKEKGLNAYREEIEKLVGINSKKDDNHIPFTIEMNLKQFSALTDLLGGLKMFILSPVDVPADENNKERYLLPSGTVLLDGAKIVEFVSYRIPEETEEAVQNRMQNILVAFLYALREKRDFILHKDVFPLFYKNMTTNMSKETAATLFSYISRIDSEKLVPLTVAGKSQMVDGKTLLFPDEDGGIIREVFRTTLSQIVSTDGVAGERTYVLEVKNGTNINGLARNTSNIFKSFAYEVLAPTDADRKDYQETIVIDHIGNPRVAKSVADIINCSNIITEEISGDESTLYEDNALVDFTIILGADFDGRYVR